MHGNEPSRGAKIDAQIQAEEEEELKRKGKVWSTILSQAVGVASYQMRAEIESLIRVEEK